MSEAGGFRWTTEIQPRSPSQSGLAVCLGTPRERSPVLPESWTGDKSAPVRGNTTLRNSTDSTDAHSILKDSTLAGVSSRFSAFHRAEAFLVHED